MDLEPLNIKQIVVDHRQASPPGSFDGWTDEQIAIDRLSAHLHISQDHNRGVIAESITREKQAQKQLADAHASIVALRREAEKLFNRVGLMIGECIGELRQEPRDAEKLFDRLGLAVGECIGELRQKS